MSIEDQNMTTPSAGQSDWDTDLNANFTILARGFHKLFTAGTAINTGAVVDVASDGFVRPFHPASLDSRPRAFAYKAVSSGEQDTFLLYGLVRSLDVLSASVPGQSLFAASDGTGYVVASYSAADRPIGYGVEEDGIYFNPGQSIFPETLTRSASVAAVTGSSHTFDLDGGRGGFIRQVIMEGASADLVELQLWANSARSDKLLETVSGGVSVVGSFIDQAGLPFYNSDPSTLSGKVYGTLQVLSPAAVGSDTIGVQVVFERFR